MLRAELPVHRNKTLYGRSLTGFSGRAIGRAAWFAKLWGDHIAAVDSTPARRQEGFPFDALRVFDPTLLARGIAANGLAFFDHRTFGPFEPRVYLIKFRTVFDLDAEMIDARGSIAPANGEVDARIFEHPLGIVVFRDDRFGTKELPIESDRSR